MDSAPEEVIILGIEPKEIGWGLELSPEVKAAVAKVIELVIEGLDGFEREEKPSLEEDDFLTKA